MLARFAACACTLVACTSPPDWRIEAERRSPPCFSEPSALVLNVNGVGSDTPTIAGYEEYRCGAVEEWEALDGESYEWDLACYVTDAERLTITLRFLTADDAFSPLGSDVSFWHPGDCVTSYDVVAVEVD